MKTKKKILGGAIGSDVHVAGILNFLELAKKEGYETIYLGGALSLEKFLGSIIETNPDLIAVSYRLGKEALDKLLIEFKDLLRKNDLLKNKDFVFGGTYETAKVARKSRLFRRVFDGSESVEEVVLYLRGEMRGIKKESYPQKLVERINFKSPYPLIRHHIGLQSLEETEREIQKLARSEELD
ncbi:MAG TPA: methionine synthase, partial [Kosmotoga arenicorallina]|nr:methionine synthase [Kosmotoga arenicorallina]